MKVRDVGESEGKDWGWPLFSTEPRGAVCGKKTGAVLRLIRIQIMLSVRLSNRLKLGVRVRLRVKLGLRLIRVTLRHCCLPSREVQYVERRLASKNCPSSDSRLNRFIDMTCVRAAMTGCSASLGGLSGTYAWVNGEKIYVCLMIHRNGWMEE